MLTKACTCNFTVMYIGVAALRLLAVKKPYINVIYTFAKSYISEKSIDLLCGRHYKVIHKVHLAR